jgi:hypothetical protein
MSLSEFMCHLESLLGHPLVLLHFRTYLHRGGHPLDIPAGILDEPPELLKLLRLLYHLHKLSIILPQLLVLDPDYPLPKAALPHI